MSLLDYFKRGANATKQTHVTKPTTTVQLDDIMPSAPVQPSKPVKPAKSAKPTTPVQDTAIDLESDSPEPAKKEKKGPKVYPLPKNLKDVKPRGLFNKVRGGARVAGTRGTRKQTDTKGPLGGKTFVITGVLDGTERSEIEEMLRSYGAKVTGSVSKKTSFLVYGEKLEDGRDYTEGKKYQKAVELKIKVINQQELDTMLLEVRGGQREEPQPLSRDPGPLQFPLPPNARTQVTQGCHWQPTTRRKTPGLVERLGRRRVKGGKEGNESSERRTVQPPGQPECEGSLDIRSSRDRQDHYRSVTCG